MNLDFSNSAQGFTIGVIIYSFLILCPGAIAKSTLLNPVSAYDYSTESPFFLLESTVTTLHFSDTKASCVISCTLLPKVVFLLYFYGILGLDDASVLCHQPFSWFFNAKNWDWNSKSLLFWRHSVKILVCLSQCRCTNELFFKHIWRILASVLRWMRGRCFKPDPVFSQVPLLQFVSKGNQTPRRHFRHLPN